MQDMDEEPVWERTEEGQHAGKPARATARVWRGRPDPDVEHRWFAEVEVPPWFKRSRIYGASREQAEELAAFVAESELRHKLGLPEPE